MTYILWYFGDMTTTEARCRALALNQRVSVWQYPNNDEQRHHDKNSDGDQ